MLKKWFVFAVAAMLAGSAFAAEKESSGVTPNLDKGTKVLEGAGSISLMAEEVQLQLAYGQFVADGIEVSCCIQNFTPLCGKTSEGVRQNFLFDREGF